MVLYVAVPAATMIIGLFKSFVVNLNLFGFRKKRPMRGIGFGFAHETPSVNSIRCVVALPGGSCILYRNFTMVESLSYAGCASVESKLVVTEYGRVDRGLQLSSNTPIFCSVKFHDFNISSNFKNLKLLAEISCE